MEIAVLSDIHGNSLALENVLDRISDVDRIYNLGDIVGIGPLPAETVDILKADGRVHNVLGNHDHNTLHGTELGPNEEIPRRPHHDWVRGRLTVDQMEYLRSPICRTHKDGAEMTFMHRSVDDWWSRVPYFDDPSPGVLDEFYSNAPGDILFFGHTHIPLDVRGVTGRRYINPGSVGAENGGNAMYSRVSLNGDGRCDIEMCSVPYDREWVRENLREQEPPYWKFIFDHFYGRYPAGSHR